MHQIRILTPAMGKKCLYSKPPRSMLWTRCPVGIKFHRRKTAYFVSRLDPGKSRGCAVHRMYKKMWPVKQRSMADVGACGGTWHMRRRQRWPRGQSPKANLWRRASTKSLGGLHFPLLVMSGPAPLLVAGHAKRCQACNPCIAPARQLWRRLTACE